MQWDLMLNVLNAWQIQGPQNQDFETFHVSVFSSTPLYY